MKLRTYLMSGQSLVDFEISADKDFSDVFLRINKKVLPAVVEAMEGGSGSGGLGPSYVKSIKKTFQQSGKRDNRPSWIVTKNPRPLHDTLNLFRSFGFTVSESENEVTLSVGTDVPYARKMDEGFEGPIPVRWHGQPRVKGSLWVETTPYDSKIPARPFMFLANEDQERLKEVFERLAQVVTQEESLELIK